MIELLTPDEMGRADAAAIAAGTPGIELMEQAGRAVAAAVLSNYPEAQAICVLAGPGNNGGDGFVAARHLKDHGKTVTVLFLGEADKLRGDAAIAADRWDGLTTPADPGRISGHDAIIDALFGAGLAREITGQAADLVKAANAAPAPIIAVDLPSGINGATGQPLGAAIHAEHTVTFFRMKPGHFLMPGRRYCGRVAVTDIGIPAAVLDDIKPQARLNEPPLWGRYWSPPQPDGHKYARGHAVVVSGPIAATGAARLAATAALRAGAGLVTVASPPGALVVNASHLTAVMVRSFKKAAGLSELLADKRLNAVAIGPGAGVSPDTRGLVSVCLDGGRAVVLDADALTSFQSDPANLFEQIRSRAERDVVLTPHDGEYRRLFESRESTGNVSECKLEKARRAAAESGAVIVLKGYDTVIASPDGRAAINANAPAWLATAGSGDVLTGIAAGLLAQGMPGFEAAAMAVWLHGAAAAYFGPGMIAEDLAPAIPKAFRALEHQIKS